MFFEVQLNLHEAALYLAVSNQLKTKKKTVETNCKLNPYTEAITIKRPRPPFGCPNKSFSIAAVKQAPWCSKFGSIFKKQLRITQSSIEGGDRDWLGTF